jgi:hypothetical protein
LRQGHLSCPLDSENAAHSSVQPAADFDQVVVYAEFVPNRDVTAAPQGHERSSYPGAPWSAEFIASGTFPNGDGDVIDGTFTAKPTPHARLRVRFIRALGR